MMRCMRHFNDSSSYTGVCASCLRERLFMLIIAQNEFNQAQQQDRRLDATDLENGDDLIPVVYPNSTSPGYISRRQSDCGVIGRNDGPSEQNQRFYSTPQVGPNGKMIIGEVGRSYGKRKSWMRISWWSMFRSKSEKHNPGVSDPRRDSDVVDTGSNASRRYPVWFGKVFSGRRRTVSVEKSTAGRNQGNSRVSDKGVSPARFSDEEDENWNRRSSGSSSECSMPWNKTPKTTPAWVAPGKRGAGSNGKSGHNRNVTGFGFCWSPLVRASPSRHWNRKGISPDVIVSGDLPVVAPPKPPPCNVVALCKNRSRKLADFGRFRHHR